MKGISRIRKQLLAMVLSLAMVGGSLATPVDVRAAEAKDILLTEDTVDAVSEVSGSDDVSVKTEQGPDADTESAGDETAADTLIADYIVDETVTDSVDGTYDAMAIEPEDEIAGEEVSVSEDGFDAKAPDEDDEYTGPAHIYSLDGFSLEPDKAGTYKSVTTADEMYRNLAADGDAYILLDKDIDDMLGNGNIFEDIYYPYWCEMGTGKKVLDLNGHRFSISYNLSITNSPGEKYAESNKAFAGSTLLKVGSGTSFILHDSEGGGSLHFDGKLTHDEVEWKDVRNILEVTDGGEFIMNGGYLDGGRSKKCWAAGSDGIRSRTRYQIHANGLIAGPGAKITINGGKIEGRGYFYHKHHSEDHYVPCGAINVWDADDQTRIIINDGEFEGDGCAHGIAGVYEGNQECFTIRGGYFYTNYVTYVVREFDDDENSRECGDAKVPLKNINYKLLNVNIKTRGNIDEATGQILNFSDNDTTISPRDTFYGYGMSKVKGENVTNINSYAGLSATYDMEESATLRADYVSIWPAGNVDNPYPEGEGAPAHNIYYDWQIYDNSGNKIHPKISKFYYNTNKPDIYLSDLFKAPDDRFEYGKTYTVRCYITETYEGQYSYESQAVCEGKIRLVHYCPELNVDFEVVNYNGNLVIIPTADSLPKGSYNCEAIVTNKDTGYQYYNNGIQLTTVNGSKGFFISDTQMARSKVGAINLEVEIRVFINTEDDEGPVKQYISKSGQFKKVKKIGYLPKISCTKDNKTGDNDNANGSVRVINSDVVTLNSNITTGNYNGSFYWVDSNGTKKGTNTQNLEVKAGGSPAGDGYWRTAIDVDGTTYFSSNGINVSHDEEEIISFTVEPSEYLKKKVITSTTTSFDIQDAITAEFRTNGALVNTRKFRWILVSAPDPRIRTGEWNYNGISEEDQVGTYTYYKHKFNFSTMFSDPRVMVSGNYVLGCQLIDGSKVVAYKEVTVPITVKVDKIQAKAKRNGSVYNLKDGYIYVPEGESADFEIWAADCFTRIGCLDTVSLDDFTAGTTSLDDGSKIVIGADNGKGVQNVTYTYSSGAETSFKVVHPITEFAIDSVTAPVVGQKIADTTVTVPTGANYKASVRWLIGSSDVLTEKFEANRVYTAVVTIIPNAGVVMPVKFEGNYTSLDNDPVRVKARFAGETDYRYLSASNTIDGFVDDDSQFTTSPSVLPVSTGDMRSAYQITYMTYPRLKDSDTTYLGRLDINFDTNLAGKGKNAMSFAYDPSEAIDTSAVEYYGPDIKTSTGSDLTGVFEDGNSYTCTLKGIGSKGVYRFADDLRIYVNGQALNRSDYKLNATMNTLIDEVTFGFKVNENKPPQTVSTLNVSVPVPAAGTAIETRYGDLVPSDPVNSPEWSGTYFKDTNNNGKFDAGEDDFTADGDRFVTGKTYGVHVGTYGNDDYVLGEGFTIICNGETKTAAVAEGYASADFIFSIPTYTVAFSLNGKPGTAPSAQTLWKDGKVSKPSDPTTTDHKFAGWYTKATCKDDEKYDFNTPVTGSFTLYAKWIDLETWTVTFDLNKHGDETKKPEPQKIKNGAKVTKPAPDPEDPGYKFTGWFKDSACTMLYDFNTPVETGFTLYAGWVKKAETVYTVTFDLNGVTDSKVDAQVVKKGSKAVEPEAPITKEKKLFAGWYTKKTCNDDEKYDFKTAVTGNITLFAKWVDVKDDDLIVTFDDDEDEGLIWIGGRYIHYYTSKKITPSVEVTDGYGHTLVKGVDYTIAYGNNINVDKKGKPAVVTIKGKGNYSSSKKLYFYILPRSLGDGTAINKPADNVKISQTADGEVLVKEGAAAAPIISYGDYQLKSKDYIIIYGNAGKKFTRNDKPEDLWITILGRGNFTGSIEQIPVKLQTAREMKDAGIKVNLSKNIDFTYDGKAKELSEAQLEVKDSKGKKLTKNTDYIVRYIDNVNAGTASVVVTGIGTKTGTVTRKFKIKADTASPVTVYTETPADKIVYSISGARPKVKVTVKRDGSDILLEEGTDYKVTYSNNKKVGEKAKYTVKFINNYKGRKAVSQGFTVNPAPFDVEITAPDMIYNKPGKYTSEPYVYLMTADGRRSLLKKNDYTVVSYKAGATDITKEKKYTQDTDSVTVSITVKGKGNFAATEVTEPAAYKIRKAAVTTKYDLSKARIADKDSSKKTVANKEYTGEAIEPRIDVYAKPISGGNEEKVDPALYDVTYINNVEKGNAIIIVTAKDTGNTAVGSKSVKFKIVSRGFAKLFQLMK